ncbi:aspartate/glutamate racemase family protein [Martelella lutilitoris]|uniref:Aspartate/glutamate racemase family protein n=1 Tax=Martelella lutilitoris TaxID=2583532 RepID=A0A5C4JY06_9HYPH|nr:aspartate/glutamate racemase family protein [Martelella lutilitoris]TNB49489.1 aspartate/glutamate racemase family protein [Martelella lutilitoris]
MKRIGLIGGMSWESTAVYYKHINEEVRRLMGDGLASADLCLRSVNFSEIVAQQKAGRWDLAAETLISVARELEQCGCAMVLICTNTMHILADEVQAAIDIPLIHIAEVTGAAVKKAGKKRPLLLATRYTMEKPFYVGYLKDHFGLDPVIPGEADRATVHDVIFEEICCGVLSGASRERYIAIAERARQKGADCIIFGCTEVGLLVRPDDFDIPSFDSTLLHAEAAVRFSLEDELSAEGKESRPVPVH